MNNQIDIKDFFFIIMVEKKINFNYLIFIRM